LVKYTLELTFLCHRDLRNAVNVPGHKQYCLLFYSALPELKWGYSFLIDGVRVDQYEKFIFFCFNISMCCWWSERNKEESQLLMVRRDDMKGCKERDIWIRRDAKSCPMQRFKV